ncbi:MAG: DUF493 domain-containing protein [Neisseria sp.]|nr:DUF493 domain-containing protein [Neisseria sp.]
MSEQQNAPQTPETLVEFPCTFPLKVMGVQDPDFESKMLETIRSQIPETHACDISVRPSSKGNYLGATANVYVSDKEQLDNIYRALTAHPLVKVVL